MTSRLLWTLAWRSPRARIVLLIRTSAPQWAPQTIWPLNRLRASAVTSAPTYTRLALFYTRCSPERRLLQVRATWLLWPSTYAELLNAWIGSIHWFRLHSLQLWRPAWR